MYISIVLTDRTFRTLPSFDVYLSSFPPFYLLYNCCDGAFIVLKDYNFSLYFNLLSSSLEEVTDYYEL